MSNFSNIPKSKQTKFENSHTLSTRIQFAFPNHPYLLFKKTQTKFMFHNADR